MVVFQGLKVCYLHLHVSFCRLSRLVEEVEGLTMANLLRLAMLAGGVDEELWEVVCEVVFGGGEWDGG